MYELLFLLLPVAAVSGWYLGLRSKLIDNKKKRDLISSKYFTGLNYILNEEPDQAVNVLIQLLDKDADTVDIHLMLGNLFRKRGEVDRAIKVHKAILLKSNLQDSYRDILNLELAKDYISAGLLDRAEEILLNLIDNLKQLESSLKLLISIYEESKDWEKAINACIKLQLITKKDQSKKISHFYCEIAISHLQTKSYSFAKRTLNQALKYNPKSVRVGILLADLNIMQSNFKSAIKVLENLVLHAENYLSEIVPKIIKCYEYLGKTKDFDKVWSVILKKNNNIKVILAYVSFLQAKKGDVKALDYLNRHLLDNPSILGLSKTIELNLFLATDKFRDKLENFNEIMAKLIQKNYNFKCKSCGLASKVLEWQCPSCKEWDSFYSTSLFELS